MYFSTGSRQHTYQPMTTDDTTSSSYWLNWRVLLCAIWMLSSMVVAAILIWKYEGPRSEKREGAESREETVGTLYADEPWRPCLKEIHPVWLLAYRVVAFFILLGLLVVNVLVDGGSIFYYYTQWTFALVTIYFGLGSVLSTYGCHHYFNKIGGSNRDSTRLEHDMYMAPRNAEISNARRIVKTSSSPGGCQNHEIAGIWVYVFQIIYQTNAGAVLLTDGVFWLVIVPFLAMRNYDLNFILIGMHSVNAVCFLGDTSLNSMRFPWFRISYFLLWTATYSIFQWVIHAFIPIWWPYPFLDLSSPHAPLWYFVVAVMHIPCYAIFTLVIKLKHYLLSKYFSDSYILG